jgi:arabinofuranosyltransferase
MSTRLVSRIVLGAALLYAAGAAALFPEWTVDDAYITYRYAANLATTGQLTWNPGDDPVEGYTGVLLPLVLAAAASAGLDVDVASEGIGAGAFLLLVGAVARASRAMGSTRTASATAALLAATAPIMATHATSGLETALFAALLTTSLDALVRAVGAESARGRRESWLFAALLALSLTRPEGVVFAALATVAIVATRARVSRGLPWATLGRLAAILAVPGALYFAWRVAYYGTWLPNTFYAKLHHRVTPDSLASGAKFAVVYLALPALATGALFAARGRQAWARLREAPSAARWGAGVVVLFILIVAAQYARSALIMNFSYRFWAPFLPAALALLAATASLAWPPPRRAVWAAAALVALQLAGHVVLTPREWRFAEQTERLLADEHRPVAAFLRERVPPGETIVVVVDAGAIPYYSGFRTIDFGGLNDEFLARRFVDRVPPRRVVDYFFSHDAAAAVFTSSEWDRVVGPEPAPVVDDPRFERYVLAARFRSDAFPEYFEHVYLRRDLADGGALP